MMANTDSSDPIGTLLPSAGVDFVPTAHHDTYAAIDPSKADFRGRIIAITGASKGIGKSIAIAFAQAGASGILLIARSNMALVEREVLAAARQGSDLKVASVSIDTTDPAQAARAVDKAREVFGRLDVLVNNAGLMEDPSISIEDMDPVVWWQTWEVNMRGTYNVTRAFLPFMIECGGEKTVLNLSSVAAHLFMKGATAYQMSKMALLRFSELLMVEYGDRGLLSIALHPGSIKTDMASTLGPEWESVLLETVELAAHSAVWLVWERREWLAGRYVSALWDVDELVAKRQEIVDSDKLKIRMVI